MGPKPETQVEEFTQSRSWTAARNGDRVETVVKMLMTTMMTLVTMMTMTDDGDAADDSDDDDDSLARSIAERNHASNDNASYQTASIPGAGAKESNSTNCV